MPRYFIFPVFMLAIAFAAPAAAADKPSGDDGAVIAGGLSCFSVELAAANASGEWAKGPSCNALCAKKSASCTGAEIIDGNGAIHVPDTCADPPLPHFTECRCCAVAR